MIDAGALGLKAFLSPSGIDDFGNVSLAHVTGALPTLMALGVPLYVHAELVTEPPEPEARPLFLVLFYSLSPLISQPPRPRARLPRCELVPGQLAARGALDARLPPLCLAWLTPPSLPTARRPTKS